MRKLNQELLKLMVRPYYIFHPKRVKGTAHFWVKIEEGLEVMEYLRGYTSGLAIPNYIINAPQGYGKVPLLPQYLLWLGRDEAVIRTWENRIIKVENREMGGLIRDSTNLSSTWILEAAPVLPGRRI